MKNEFGRRQQGPSHRFRQWWRGPGLHSLGQKKALLSIRKRTRGLYVLMEYSGGPDMVAELERNLRIDERILKFITGKARRSLLTRKRKRSDGRPWPPRPLKKKGRGNRVGVAEEDEDEEAMPESFDEEEGMQEEDEEE